MVPETSSGRSCKTGRNLGISEFLHEPLALRRFSLGRAVEGWHRVVAGPTEGVRLAALHRPFIPLAWDPWVPRGFCRCGVQE
jgi:hypothetical protein